MKFQSTLSVRRATWSMPAVAEDGVISIHALREESDGFVGDLFPELGISIHALREESDCRA